MPLAGKGRHKGAAFGYLRETDSLHTTSVFAVFKKHLVRLNLQLPFVIVVANLNTEPYFIISVTGMCVVQNNCLQL